MERKHETERELTHMCRLIDIAVGRIPADLVLKNASYVNVFTRQISQGDIALAGETIAGIGTYRGNREIEFSNAGVVLPGLIDAHIHLESALVSPEEFARAVLPHGTTAVVTDPHEIANVMGADGISYMLQATENLPVTVFFMLPSCVPATPLDESGAELDWRAIEPFYTHPRVVGLAEVMNSPGVTAGDEAVIRKLLAAKRRGVVIDGHAPGLSGNVLNAYLATGVASDHECSTMEDALSKLSRGAHIMLREGTAAHNLEALAGLLTARYADRCMLCCDDRHPGDLLERGHIDALLRQAVALGADPMQAVRAATWNTARYFGLEGRGAIAPGYRADLTLVEDLNSFFVRQVYTGGVLGFDGETVSLFTPAVEQALKERAGDTVHIPALTPEALAATRPLGVIELVPGELITEYAGFATGVAIDRNILKLTVVERHHWTGHLGLGYLKGYGLRRGAVASSVAHDAHNIIAAGVDDADIAAAVNRVAQLHGGLVIVEGGNILAEIPLPIAGLMSDRPLAQVSAALEKAKQTAYSLGVPHSIDPFMTLSFLSLPVIPGIRLTTHGVFDVARQCYL